MKNMISVSLRSQMRRFGESLKKARLRRRLKMTTVAERAGISRETLAKIQKGDPGVSFGNYAAVIYALGLGTDWMSFVDLSQDKVGQALEDERLPKRVRSTG